MNIKSTITKRVKAKVEKQWTGDDLLYVWNEETETAEYDSEMAEAMLEGMFLLANVTVLSEMPCCLCHA